MKTIKLYSIAIFAFAMPFIAKAQIDSSAFKLPNKVAHSYFFQESYWMNSINASKFYQSGVRNYSNVEVSYEYNEGDYKRVFDPKKNSIIGFSTIGIKSYKKLHFLGTFDYKRQISKDIDWSLIMDADRDNPYIIADSIGGDWLKEKYSLGLKVSSEPLWNFIHLGLNMNYTVSLGGRDNDPRPKTTSKNIFIAPSATFILGEKSSIGLSYIYGDYMQDVDVMIKSGVGSAVFYKVLGLALKENPIVKSSYDYRIEAFKQGGSLLYSTSFGDASIMAEGSYIHSTEKDIYSPYASQTDPETGEVSINSVTDARFSEKQYEINLGTDFAKLRVPQKINIGVSYAKGKLYNCSTSQVEYNRKKYDYSFKYTALLNASNIGNATSISIGANYAHEESDQAFYAKRNVESLTAFAKANHSLKILGQSFCGEIGIRSKFNLSSDFTINPESVFIEPETDITKPMVWSAYYFDSAEWISPSAAITYYPTLSKSLKPYLNVNWTGIILTNNDYYKDGTRTFAQIKFGLLF